MDGGFRSPFLAGSRRNSAGDRRALMQDYDIENQVELVDLVEDSDEGSSGGKRTSFDEETRLQSGHANGGSIRVKKERVRSNPKG
jgi:hypothetical protein